MTAQKHLVMATFWDRVAGIYDQVVDVFDWHGDQLRVVQDIASGTVMEVCCGTGYVTRALLERGVDAYGQDLADRYRASDGRRGAERAGRGGARPGACGGSRRDRAAVRGSPILSLRLFDYVISTGSLGLFPEDLKRAALAEMVRVCRGEVRLLEPIESKEGFYWGRMWTFMVDGHRPIPRRVFEELDLAWRVAWDTMGGIFSYARVWRR